MSNDPLIKLKQMLYNVVGSDVEKQKQINDILNKHIEVYSQYTSISRRIIENPAANVKEIKEHQDRKIAAEMGLTLINRGHLKIEVCNPEDYRDYISGEIPDWAQWQERRMAKLWVLK